LHRHAAQFADGNVIAAYELLGRRRRDAMPKIGAPSRRPRNIVPGLAPNFSAS